ncbi:MAG TPA: GNAT family N-acetyltransferase [Anaerolineales bacterium]|nr:GNAT family N-acetyltransferase [Anaerolineales bacterium]
MMSTTQFTIRRAEPSDVEAMHRIYSMPGVIRGTLQLPYPSVENWRKRIAEPPDGTFNLLVCAGNEVIGQLGLHTFPHHPRRRHVGQIGMAVRDDWQGKGAGSALMQAMIDLADQWLNLSRIELEVYTDNESAIHLYKKFGFAIEGTHPRFAFREGEFVDVYAMARLKQNL